MLKFNNNILLTAIRGAQASICWLYDEVLGSVDLALLPLMINLQPHHHHYQTLHLWRWQLRIHLFWSVASAIHSNSSLILIYTGDHNDNNWTVQPQDNWDSETVHIYSVHEDDDNCIVCQLYSGYWKHAWTRNCRSSVELSLCWVELQSLQLWWLPLRLVQSSLSFDLVYWDERNRCLRCFPPLNRVTCMHSDNTT